MVAKAATRYAKAFMKSAIEKDKLEKAKSDILLIQDVLQNSSELRSFLKSPLIKKEVKTSALLEVFKGKVDELTISLLQLISEKGREELLLSITKSFVDLYNKHMGITEVHIVTSLALDEKQKSSLQKKLETETGKKVSLHTSVDERLIGGLQVRIDDTVIDGSVKYKLNQLKEKFTAEAVN